MKTGRLSLLLCVLLVGSVVAADGERIVARHKAVFTQPARRIPSRVQTDAPLLGNGDMGVALGGAPEAQRYWLAKNDFWRLQSQYNTSGPRVFGGVDVSVGELKGASYRVEQGLLEAVTRSTFVKGDLTVTMRAWVAATKNVLVVELSAKGKSAQVTVKLWPTEGGGGDHDSGVEGEVHWVSRKFVRNVDIPSGAAAAMKVIGAKGLSFPLRPGKTVTVAVGMDSVFKNKAYVAGARKLVAGLDEAALRSLWKAHAAWWRGYWAKSFVELDDAAIEQRYYLSNYVMGSCSRDPDFPPSIFGTWITVDNPAWSSDYHLNYNHMAPFYGLYSSNHIVQADPYHGPVLDFMPRGRFYAKSILGIRGVYYPVGIGPKGIETTRQVGKTRYGQPGSRNTRREDDGLFFGQKSNSAYCVVNLSMRWYLTYDKAYAKAVYPFVREVADFWEDYLRFEPASSAEGGLRRAKEGRYVIYKDSIHEGSGQNTNAILSLGLVRNVFETALDMSGELGVDGDRHEKWKHILKHLSGYTTQEKGGKTIFRYSEQGTAWWGSNTLGIQQIYPAGAIGLQSDPKLLKLSRDTITVMGRWIDGNGTNSFFPAAVRVGYDPKIILKHLHGYVTRHCQPNGFAAHNPHGIENCSVVPNTINMMLCMGHQNVLRVFGVWPRDRNARFGNIRAQGAFLVSAELAGGQVQYVVIRSERGRPCTLVNPWPGKAVVLYRGGKAAETLRGQRVKFPTAVGEEIVLASEGTSLDELRGRMRPRAPQPTISPPGGVIWGPNMVSITAPAGCSGPSACPPVRRARFMSSRPATRTASPAKATTCSARASEAAEMWRGSSP